MGTGGNLEVLNSDDREQHCGVRFSGNRRSRLSGPTECRRRRPSFPSSNGGISGGVVHSSIVVGNTADGTPNTSATGQNNIIDAPFSTVLLDLATNGGRTLTHALANGSPAIDAGTLNFLPADRREFDQRRAARVNGNAADVGAFESDSTAPFPFVQFAIASQSVQEQMKTPCWSKLC